MEPDLSLGFIGITLGYLAAKFPPAWHRWRAWRAVRARAKQIRKLSLRPAEAAYVHRVRGMYATGVDTSNTGPELFWGEKILDSLESLPLKLRQRWEQFLEDTAPRDPIKMVRH